jgi:Ca2+:H+ antiporter
MVNTEASTDQPRAGASDGEGRTQGLGAAVHGLCKEPLYWLLVALPLAVALDLLRTGGLWVFLASAAAIVPLAGLMGRATESLARALGPGIGGLLNATFGNAAELIIALFALARGPEMYPLVKASLTGSVIGNVLLVLGASIVAGGFYYRKQRFNRTAASMGATLLALASVGLVMPALFYHLLRARAGLSGEELRRIESLSEEIAAVLALIYLLSLFFTLVTHRDLFSGEEPAPAAGAHPRPEWHWGTGLTLLLAATAGVAWMSHLLVGTVEQARAAFGMNEVFVGVIVVAVIGNAAEHSTAVLMAVKDKMDATVQIAVGSGIQVALFVAPVLVFASMVMGHPHPLDLHFSLLETVTVVIAVVVLALVCQDGETHWMEGAMMLGVYVIIALAFYNLPG